MKSEIVNHDGNSTDDDDDEVWADALEEFNLCVITGNTTHSDDWKNLFTEDKCLHRVIKIFKTIKLQWLESHLNLK